MKVGKITKIYLNDENGKRKVRKAMVLAVGQTSFRVRLPDGNEIARKKSRDIVE